MGRRLRAICKSIIEAICSDKSADNKTRLSRICAFFAVLEIVLARVEWEKWRSLRSEVWEIDESEYKQSFRVAKDSLTPIGDLGYSGSTFFTTPDSKFLIKSIPRRFEYTFFEKDLLQPYLSHMRENPTSLLVRILDFLNTPYKSIGRMLRLVPNRHIVMENALYGRDTDAQSDKWETYDLKPLSYFFPERDLLDGALASEATLSQLADRFEDRIRITKPQLVDLKTTLEKDTEFLAQSNAVDYSLFVVRCPPSSSMKSVASRTGLWRDGVTSYDGKWKYRMVVLDFFWAKHKFFPQALTGMVKGFNVVAKKGNMSITTTPQEYRKRFLRMVDDLVQVQAGS